MACLGMPAVPVASWTLITASPALPRNMFFPVGLGGAPPGRGPPAGAGGAHGLATGAAGAAGATGAGGVQAAGLGAEGKNVLKLD